MKIGVKNQHVLNLGTNFWYDLISNIIELLIYCNKNHKILKSEELNAP